MKRVVDNGFLNMPPLTVEFCWNFRREVRGRFLGADSVVAGVASVSGNYIGERGNLPWLHSEYEDHEHMTGLRKHRSSLAPNTGLLLQDFTQASFHLPH